MWVIHNLPALCVSLGPAGNGGYTEQRVSTTTEPSQTSHMEIGDSHVSGAKELSLFLVLFCLCLVFLQQINVGEY